MDGRQDGVGQEFPEGLAEGRGGLVGVPALDRLADPGLLVGVAHELREVDVAAVQAVLDVVD